MRRRRIGTVVALAGLLGIGCDGRGDVTDEGFFQVVITDERLEAVSGDRCAVRGNATNGGNLRARVDLRFEALSAQGAVLGESTASFEVAPFSNFEFRNAKGNQDGQPSSTVFTNDLDCGGIANFERVKTSVSRA